MDVSRIRIQWWTRQVRIRKREVAALKAELCQREAEHAAAKQAELRRQAAVRSRLRWEKIRDRGRQMVRGWLLVEQREMLADARAAVEAMRRAAHEETHGETLE